jgi:hypothetical protein
MMLSRRFVCAVAVGLICAPRLAFAGSFNTVLQIPEIAKRNRANDDWLAGVANLAAWQSEISGGEGTVLQQIRNPQRWRDVFDEDNGLAKTDLAAFAADAGLVVDGSSSLALKHWNQVLIQSGPVWVGVANQRFKAGRVWVVTGVVGDGSADGTELSIINVASGDVDKMTTKEFTDLYTAAAKADGVDGKVALQVLRLA